MINDQRVTAIVAAVGQLMSDSGVTRAYIKDYLTVNDYLIPLHNDQIANLIAREKDIEKEAFQRGRQEQAFVPASKSPESSVTTTPMTIETHDVEEIPSDISDENPVAATPRLQFPQIEGSWSPEDARVERAHVKVRSLNHNQRALRGGDWLSIGKVKHKSDGSASTSFMTLSTTWVEHNDKQYGLTVAHPFIEADLGVGASVFAFNSDEEEIVKAFGSTRSDANKRFRTIKIGSVAAINKQTDSAIIHIDRGIKIDPYAVALNGGDDQVYKVKFPKPYDNTNPMPHGTTVVMYGAARRGMMGILVDPSEGKEHIRDLSADSATQSFISDEDGQRISNGKTMLTLDGDCGALSIAEDMTVVSMHTAIAGRPCKNPVGIDWTSYGVPIQEVVNAHAHYFGVPGGPSRAIMYQKQSSPGRLPHVGVLLKPSDAENAEGRFPTTINIHFDDDKEKESEGQCKGKEDVSDWFFWRRPVPESAFGKVHFSDDDEEEGAEEENRGI